MEFEAFQKLHRIKRWCVITEKVDGTNAQIAFDEDGTMYVGSRTRWITPDDDNFGFARWAHEHAEVLRALGPGRHFGEWYGAGIQRKYGLTEKRFVLFDTERWADGRPECCGVVPIVYCGDFSTDAIDNALETLRVGGSLIAPGFMNPEGVVVYMPQARAAFKVTLGGDGHKGADPATAARMRRSP
jgi:hypothetical protein